MRNQALKILSDLVSFPSFVGMENPKSEFLVSQYLEKLFLANFLNFKLKKIKFEGKYRANLLFQNSKHIRILFACHMDTVPPSSNKMFKIKRDGDRVLGLGTKDMKGGIVSTILALKQIKDIPGIGVLFYGDEETSFKGILSITKKSKVLFSDKISLIVSPESRFNLGIGARGLTVLKLSIQGKKAHSARPHMGIDAVKLFYVLANNVEEFINDRKSDLGKSSLNIAHIHGGILSADGKDITYLAGTVPDHLIADISIRNAQVKLTGQQILKLFISEGRNLKLKVQGKIVEDYPARYTPKIVVNKVFKAIKASGFDVEISDPGLGGFNDMTILGKKIDSPVVNFGPYGEGNHSKDEWVSLKSILDTSKVFEKLVIEFCNK